MPLDPTLPAPDFSRSVTEPTVTPSLGVAGTLAPPPAPQPQQAVHPNAQQLAEIDSQLAEQGQPPAPRHPLWDFTPEQLVDLQRNTDGKYNFVQQFSEDREAQQDPAIRQKVEDAYAMHLEKGITGGDVGNWALGVVPGLAHWLWSMGQSTVGRMATGIRATYEGGKGDLTGLTPEKQTGGQEFGEQVAGTESQITGNIEKASRFGAGLLHQTKEKLGLAKPYTELSQEEKGVMLSDALSHLQALKTIAAAHGPIMSTLYKALAIDPNDPRLKAITPRPEEVALHAEGDPVSLAAMGELFGLSGKALRAITPEAAKALMEDAQAWASKKSVQATGAVITGVGKTAEGAAKVTKVVAPAGGAVLGGAGLLGEHPGIGAFVGYKAGKELVENLEKHEPQLKALTDLGRQVSGAKPLVSNLAQAIRSGAEVIPAAATDLLKGAAFDVALGAGTVETPEDLQGLGFGTLMGGLGAGKRFGTHVISGQIVGPREYGSVVAVPGSGSYPGLEKLHQQAMQSAAPGVRNRMNAIRGFARAATPNAEHFLTAGADPEAIKAAITAAGGNAAMYDPLNRGQSLTLPNGKNVVLTSDIAAAPHEAGHPLEKVIGEDGMSRWDDWAQQHYGPIWNDFGKRYAGALGWTPSAGSIQDFLADKSGFGRNDALEKLVGEGKSAADAYQYLADVEKQGGSWKDILTPDEQQAAGDRYISRELFAEHFDTLFKRSGGKPGIDPTGLQKVAIGIGNLVSGLGGNPIPGTTSEGLKAPLSFEALQRVQAATKAAAPTIEPAKPVKPAAAPTVLGRGVIPSTPAQQQQAVEEAKLAVAAQTTQENKDNLSTAADAIAKGSGILADTATEQGKKFFPYRIVPTKEGGHTILGWDPDIFNQNAHDLARYVADHPELQAAFPFQIDPKQRSLTADEWDRFNKARDTYVANQLKGYTGSGEPLVVPKETQERAGVFPPPVTGAPESLPQPVADLMNHLFGGTGELSAVQKGERATGKLPRNIQAQEISEATMPGRVSPLIQPRVFAGKAAEEKGLAGVPIKEVNPLRKQMQLASPGLPKPKGVLQQLDVDKIKKITPAPELPNFRANTLTTTAGFMPKETQAFISQIDTSKPAEWSEIVKGFNGRYGGGQTGLSFSVGSKVGTLAELTALRESYGRSSEMVKSAMESKDYDLASHFASKAQAAREAYEAATGETFDGKQGASADFIRSHFDPNYKAPMQAYAESAKTFIVRHGSTELNNADPDKDKIRGHQDIPLSEPARKSKEDWKLREDPSQLFSKAWITPDGKPIQLGGQWHHEWVNQNPDLAKKYGLKATTSGEENRSQALQKGFARVNYERNTGTLKVEARAQDWPKLRESVRRLAEVNLGKIDNMDVHLLDASAKKIVDQDGVALHTYDADEKMDHFPLISEPTSTTSMSAQAGAETVQFTPGNREDDISEIPRARQFWVLKSGELIPAPEGHESSGLDILPEELHPPFDEETHLEDIYKAMRKAGHIRGNVMPRRELITEGPSLTPATRKTLEDISHQLQRPIYHNNRLLESGFIPPELKSENVQYMPDMDPRAIRAASVRGASINQQKLAKKVGWKRLEEIEREERQLPDETASSPTDSRPAIKIQPVKRR